MKKIFLIFGIALILLITYVGYSAFQQKNSNNSPLIDLNDANSTYMITRKQKLNATEYQYYLIQVKPGQNISSTAEFPGNAVAISGSDVPLDQFLDQPVEVEAKFEKAGTSTYSGDAFYINDVRLITATTPDGETVACTMEAKECPDGSFVGRMPPNCEFAACP